MNGDTRPLSETSPNPHQEPASPDAPEGAGPPAADTTNDPAPPGEPGSSPPVGTDENSNAGREQELEQRLAAQQAEHELLRSQYMRIAADFDNFRKRQSRDQEELRLRITSTTLSEILPVVDNFERARQQINPESEEAQTVHRSYQSLYKQLVEVLKQLGVSAMRVEGEPFDPSVHEAVLRAESHEHPPDVVIEELQRGYQLNERVLRHALVKVSMGPGPAANVESQQDERSDQEQTDG